MACSKLASTEVVMIIIKFFSFIQALSTLYGSGGLGCPVLMTGLPFRN